MRKLALVVVALLLTASLTPSLPQQLRVVGYAWILVPAVMQTDSGYAWTVANVTVFVTEGWGDVYVSTYSLTQEDFQGAATAAARVICSLLNVNFSNYNFYFKVVGPAIIVGGPSAAVAMAVAVYSALTGQPVNRSVMVTGIVSPDGTVGPVGGVFEKAQAAAAQRARVFLVPPGQSIVITYRTVVQRVGPFQFYTVRPETLNLSDYAWREWRLRVVEVATIEDALYYFFDYKAKPLTPGRVVLSTRALSIIFSVRSKLLSTAESELAAANSSLSASGVDALTRRFLSRYLSTANQYLARARGDTNVESIPLLATSIAYSRWVKLLVDYYMRRPLDHYVSRVSSQLSEVMKSVEGAGASDFTDLNVLIIAANLAISASRLYNDSASAWQSDPATALQNLAFASALLDEARLWLGAVRGGAPLQARQAAATYISVARTSLSYAYAVLSQAGADMTMVYLASKYYRAATSMYSSGRTFLAAVAAAKCVALSEAALASFQATASGADVYLKFARRQAEVIASSAIDSLAAVYYVNYTALSGFAADQLAWLKHATHLGSLALELSRAGGLAEQPLSSAPQAPQQSQPNAPQSNGGEREESILDKLLRVLSALVEAINRALKSLADWLLP